MGGQEFYEMATGASMGEAFTKAFDQAQWEYGHGGYTGSIAEKPGAHLLQREELPDEKAAMVVAEKMLRGDDPIANDKWGPAACLSIQGGKWLFFGVASS